VTTGIFTIALSFQAFALVLAASAAGLVKPHDASFLRNLNATGNAGCSITCYADGSGTGRKVESKSFHGRSSWVLSACSQF
jgi:hypothetical protein